VTHPPLPGESKLSEAIYGAIMEQAFHSMQAHLAELADGLTELYRTDQASREMTSEAIKRMAFEEVGALCTATSLPMEDPTTAFCAGVMAVMGSVTAREAIYLAALALMHARSHDTVGTFTQEATTP
jgi:hypothetical protein